MYGVRVVEVLPVLHNENARLELEQRIVDAFKELTEFPVVRWQMMPILNHSGGTVAIAIVVQDTEGDD
jgi:hypothetical protein